MKIKLIKSLTILGSFIALSVAVQAQSNTFWTGAVDENWSNSGNWSNELPGVAGGYAIIDNGGTARITSETANFRYANIGIYIGPGDYVGATALGYLFIDGVTNNTTGNLYIGWNGGSGHLEMTNSYWRTSEAFALGFASNNPLVNSTAIFRNSELYTSMIVIASGNDGVNVMTIDASIAVSSATFQIGATGHVILQNSGHASFETTSNMRGHIKFIDGTFSSATGTMTAGPLSNLEFVLSSAETKLSVNELILNATSTLTLVEGDEAFVGGESFDIFDITTITGTFGTINTSTLAAGLSWDLSELYTTGVVSIIGAIIPEPSTYAAIFGILALAWAIYRRRK